MGLTTINVSDLSISADRRWMSMGYPMKKEMKIKLIFVYYEIICELTS